MKVCSRCGEPAYPAEGPDGRYTCRNGSNRNPTEPCFYGKNGSCFWGVPSKRDYFCSFKFAERNIEATLDEVSDLMYLTRERIRQIEIEALTKFREAWETIVEPWEKKEKHNGKQKQQIDITHAKVAFSNVLALAGMFGEEDNESDVEELEDDDDNTVSLNDINTLEDMVKFFNEGDGDDE